MVPNLILTGFLPVEAIPFSWLSTCANGGRVFARNVTLATAAFQLLSS